MTIPRQIRRNIFVLIAAALLGAGMAQEGQDQDQQSQGDDPVVLRVGDYEETRSEFDARFEVAIRSLVAGEGVQMTDAIRAQMDGFKESFLEQRVLEASLVEEARERGIEVSDAEIDEIIAGVTAGLPEGVGLENLLDQAGFQSEEQLRTMLRETEYVNRVLAQLQDEVEVTSEQIEQFYAENPEIFAMPEQVCARHILVETEEQAAQALERIEAGEEFAAVADEVSTDPGTQGGDLGCFPRGTMVPPFEEAAFGAELNEVTGPVESQFGQHLILVYDQEEPGSMPLEEASPLIEQQLQQVEASAAIEEVVERQGAESFPENLGIDLEASPDAQPGEPVEPVEPVEPFEPVQPEGATRDAN